MLLVTFILADVALAVRPLEPPLAVHAALDPLPLVAAPVGPGEDPLALQRVLDELAGVARAAVPLERAGAVLLPVGELTAVLAVIGQPLEALAVLPALRPPALVAGAVGLRQLALAVSRTSQPGPNVRGAVGPALRALAVGLPVRPHLPRVDAALWDQHVLHVAAIGQPLLRPAASDMRLREVVHDVLLLVHAAQAADLPADAMGELLPWDRLAQRHAGALLPHATEDRGLSPCPEDHQGLPGLARQPGGSGSGPPPCDSQPRGSRLP
mmetsp:Transcript_1003/g.3104  ORF Transcript_1003/g.3104 Transcript_1003/m.3104 type:complete len:268 (-) Transcript_1003:2-805(-)